MVGGRRSESVRGLRCLACYLRGWPSLGRFLYVDLSAEREAFAAGRSVGIEFAGGIVDGGRESGDLMAVFAAEAAASSDRVRGQGFDRAERSLFVCPEAMTDSASATHTARARDDLARHVLASPAERAVQLPRHAVAASPATSAAGPLMNALMAELQRVGEFAE
jgi:hypothetical protein